MLTGLRQQSLRNVQSGLQSIAEGAGKHSPFCLSVKTISALFSGISTAGGNGKNGKDGKNGPEQSEQSDRTDDMAPDLNAPSPEISGAEAISAHRCGEAFNSISTAGL